MKHKFLKTGLACLAVSLFGMSATGQVADQYNPTVNTNYWNVYLAPATHGTANQGCQLSPTNSSPYIETHGAWWIAHDAITNTSWPDNFRDRGYTTYLGRQTSSISQRLADAKLKGADIYLPIHSNAAGLPCHQSSSAYGMWLMYENDAGGFNADLANKLKAWIGPVTPGQNDKTCPWRNCYSGSTLPEATTPLNFALSTVYIEAEFHTWQQGVDFLWNDWTWRTRIAEAVSWQLGWPELYN